MQQVSDKLLNWASEIDEGTLVQAGKASRLPIIAGHVALMPDAHVGMGATVGSVIPTENAVIPAAVGVDIGCGMIAVETDLTSLQLPTDLSGYMPKVERVVPAGLGKWHADISAAASVWFKANPPTRPLDHDLEKRAMQQFGTLGSGNHFFEVCLDEDDKVWIVLHSGSRGVGNKLAERHIQTAKKLSKYLNFYLEDPDLAYLMEGTPEFQDYINDLLWSQSYAAANRNQMMNAALREFFKFVGTGRQVYRVNCHHNFTQQEVHNIDGIEKKVWITRKGAIKADTGDLGIIPGSMGTRSYIVRGKGNPLSYNSCSHGAGRRYSRTAARKRFTTADMNTAMQGKTWQSGSAEDLLDEIPGAYKDIDRVMEDQSDLVEVVAVLHQVFNYKGTGDTRRKK